MQPEIKKAWIEALRSGAYAQTRGALKVSRGYCCLGVLCDLYAREYGIEWQRDEMHYNGYKLLGEESTLPKEVMEWAGLSSADPCLDGKTGPLHGTTLAWANDKLKWNFILIADALEKNF